MSFLTGAVRAHSARWVAVSLAAPPLALGAAPHASTPSTLEVTDEGGTPAAGSTKLLKRMGNHNQTLVRG
jgi:hypothetical protein